MPSFGYSTDVVNISYHVSPLDIAWYVVGLVAMWWIYEKMGRKGWEGIIPLYNLYVLFEVLYGKGWRFLLLLIPLYDIYLLFKYNIDLSRKFGKSGWFGVGLVFFTPIFRCILAFGKAEFIKPEPEPEIEYEF